MAKFLEFDDRALVLCKDRSTARLTKRGRSLSQTDQTVELRDDLDSCKPDGVIFVELRTESTCNLFGNLTVRLCSLL